MADVFDAITNTRPYRQGMTVPEGIAELKRLAAVGQLDVKGAEALVATVCS